MEETKLSFIDSDLLLNIGSSSDRFDYVLWCNRFKQWGTFGIFNVLSGILNALSYLATITYYFQLYYMIKLYFSCFLVHAM
jgi:hypothetical protein